MILMTHKHSMVYVCVSVDVNVSETMVRVRGGSRYCHIAAPYWIFQHKRCQKQQSTRALLIWLAVWIARRDPLPSTTTMTTRRQCTPELITTRIRYQRICRRIIDTPVRHDYRILQPRNPCFIHALHLAAPRRVLLLTRVVDSFHSSFLNCQINRARFTWMSITGIGRTIDGDDSAMEWTQRE